MSLSVLSAIFGAQAQDAPRAYYDFYDGLDFSGSTRAIRPDVRLNWVSFDCNARLRRIPAFAPFTPRDADISGSFNSLKPETLLGWLNNHALPIPYGALDTSRARIKVIFDIAGNPHQIQTPALAQAAKKLVERGQIDGTGIAPEDHERIRDYAKRVCGL